MPYHSRNGVRRSEHSPYEPTLVVGTHTVTGEQKLSLGFAGYVLGETRRYRPSAGHIVPLHGGERRFRLAPFYPTIERTLERLRRFDREGNSEVPGLILNEHCSTCPFRRHCLAEAEKEDNLSLLERMTPKLIQKYQRRGIFTVKQLSYIFKPRKRRKRLTTVPLTFNVELQALALRTGKTYLDQAPVIPEYPVELYLDIEGIPDQSFEYLIGLAVKETGRVTTHSFWAARRTRENPYSKLRRTGELNWRRTNPSLRQL